MEKYCKRLIEVDLPIKRISEHSRREKSIRHGHISTLHIWWARRPLGACRAVLCAALWPDPADPLCSEEFIKTAKNEMLSWTDFQKLNKLSDDGRGIFNLARQNPIILDDPLHLRAALLSFIADFANWNNSNQDAFIKTSQILTQSAHKSLDIDHNQKPLVSDPFAGGGAIPLEALRIGCRSFASDLNPIPYLLNKVTLELIPKYGKSLPEDLETWGNWVKDKAESSLIKFYRNENGASPIAFLWSRTVICEGPGCGVKIPMVRSYNLCRKKGHEKSIVIKYKGDTPLIELADEFSKQTGTNTRSNATCPCCGYTTQRSSLVQQAADGKIGEILLAVVERDEQGTKTYRSINDIDIENFNNARNEMLLLEKDNPDRYLISEELPYLRSIFNVNVYNINEWGKLFNSRQRLALFTFADIIKYELPSALDEYHIKSEYRNSLITLLAFCVDRIADYTSNICRWDLDQQRTINTFCRQALGMVWDYSENVPYAHTVGSWESMLNSVINVVKNSPQLNKDDGISVQSSALDQYLPENSVSLFFTDPPYYDAIPYANLSDFFIIWLKRTLPNKDFAQFEDNLSPKSNEAVQLSERNPKYKHKTKDFFHDSMRKAFQKASSTLSDKALGVIVFAHKETESWETLLEAVIKSGNMVTASWPIDTEQPQRLRAQSSAALASSVHLVVRPRPQNGEKVGEWADVLSHLPKRIHEWMPRLAEEGVVGADAIFACLGPALEIYSRYSSVEKANGEKVELKEYMEHIWAAVSKEALSMLFEDADASGFEEDARLTAMWLWTLAAQVGGNDDCEDSSGKEVAATFGLEYDTARKIAQGLGARLEDLHSIVEIKGSNSRLLSVAERTAHLFGKEGAESQIASKKKSPQIDWLTELSEGSEQSEYQLDEATVTQVGKTTLDRVHQSMILFAAGRGDAMKRFLVEDGVGQSPSFWKLGQALSALYPTGTQEKRWVDGVLARKKGLGL